MNKTHIIILSLIGSFMFTTCSDSFIEHPPLTTITDETFPTSEDDALLATNAAYNSLRDWRYPFGGFPLLDIMSDDQTKGSNPGDGSPVRSFEEFTYEVGTGSIADWYASMYEAIKRTNVVIEKVPDIAMDENLKNRYIAEARFVRALTYFNMVRAWGDMIKVTTLNPDSKLSRSPTSEIYNEIIFPDLQFAVENLPKKSEYASADLGRATKGAVNALLARIYLHQNDFVNVEKLALEVINSNEYSLDAIFADAFSVAGEHGSGSIFEIGAIKGENTGGGGNQYGNTQGVRGNPNWGWGFGRPSMDLINSFEPNDPRMDASIIFLGEILDGTEIIGDINTPDIIYTDATNTVIKEIETYNQKVYVAQSETSEDSWGHNRRIIRYADVLLMVAEALNENGKSSEALTYLNMVRTRARGNEPISVLPDVTETDQVLLRKLIWQERRVELAMENERFFDLVRQGRAAEILEPLGFVEGKHELLPIPQVEIDFSEGALTQNSNW